jgi:hypothetical protein
LFHEALVFKVPALTQVYFSARHSFLASFVVVFRLRRLFVHNSWLVLADEATRQHWERVGAEAR